MLRLRHDVVHQLIACDPRNVLHTGAHLGGVATKCQVATGFVEHEHVHIAVMKTARLVGNATQKLFSGCGAVQLNRLAHQGHSFFRGALLQPECGHRAVQRAGSLLKSFGLLHGQPHHLGVVLCDLVKLLHRAADFFEARALLVAGVGDLAHAGGHAVDASGHRRNAIACRTDQVRAGFDLPHRRLDQVANLARRLARALRQHANLGRHHGKPPTLLTRPGRLDCSIERQNIGLKGDAIDHANDFAHAPGALLNGFHRLHRTGHGLRAGVRRLPHLCGFLVGTQGGMGIVLHSGRKLFHTGGRLLQVGCLLLSPVGQRAVAMRQALAGVGHQGCVAANVSHHGRELVDHLVQRTGHLGHFVMPLQAGVHGQITLRGLLHRPRDQSHVVRQSQPQHQLHIQHQNASRRSEPPGRRHHGKHHGHQRLGSAPAEFSGQLEPPHQPCTRPQR